MPHLLPNIGDLLARICVRSSCIAQIRGTTCYNKAKSKQEHREAKLVKLPVTRPAARPRSTRGAATYWLEI